MAKPRSRFTAIPQIPTNNISDWQYYVLAALKENIELLTGARNEADGVSQAVTRGAVTIKELPKQEMTTISAEGGGFTIEGVSVPSLADYVKLLTDVQQLANDVANLRAAVAALVQQLRG